MIISPEEKSSRGPLIAFIDLLFLLVAFFTLLLFFVQQRHQVSEQALQAMQQNLSRITGDQVNVPQALETLEAMVDKLVAGREVAEERERLLAERQKRRALRETVRVEYSIDAAGRISYRGKRYESQAFLAQVVAPLRKSNWVAFRAFADAQTPFGAVVEHRRLLLKDSNEFDTYWDNVTPASPAPASQPARR